MPNEDYFESKDFLNILHKYEDAKEKGMSVYLDLDDLADLTDYFHSLGDTTRAMEIADYALSIFPGATPPLVYKARLSMIIDNDKETAEKYINTIEDKNDLEYYYIKAEMMIFDNNIADADTYLNDRLKNLNEDKYDFIMDVANLFADYEQLDYANKWLKKSTDKESTEYKEIEGRILFGKGHFKESERIYNGLIDENPFSNTYWNLLASSQFMRDHIKDSITSSEYSIAINPQDEEAILNKANGLFKLGNYDEALKYYERYSKIEPQDEIGEMYQGITLLNMEKTEDAIRHLKQAEQLAPENSPNIVGIYQELAFSLSHIGKTSEAIEYVEKADIDDKEHDEMTVLKGHIMLENDCIEDAQQYFEQAVRDSDSSFNVLLRIAVSIYDSGRYKIAYKMFKEILNQHDEDVNEVYPYIAMCAKTLGDNKKFMEYLKIVSTQNDSNTKQILGDIFPKDMEPKDYYNYMLDKLNGNK